MPPEVIRARRLRREMSYPEVLLWQRLRRAPGGIRFRRQHPIGFDYTADFYCAAAGLVIEVHGAVHAHGEAPARDRRRDEYMKSRGLAVIRVPASEVLNNADAVAAGILRLAAPPLHHSPAASGPPPQQAGEDH
jgi:very-short-patch-repair endonuclease